MPGRRAVRTRRGGLREENTRDGWRGAGAEHRRCVGALTTHAKGHVHVAADGAAERQLPALCPEHDAAVLADLEPDGPETAGLGARPVAEAEDAALEPALGSEDRDVVAVNLAVTIRDLDGDPVARLV